MTKIITWCEVHIEHWHEGAADDEVEDPLGGHGDGHRCAADGIGEDLSDKHPADGAPREHEGCRIKHDGQHRHQLHPVDAEGQGHTEGADTHGQRAGDQQRLAANLLHREDGHQGEQHIHHPHHHGVEHRVGHAHVAEDARGIVEHCVDAHHLLEDTQHDADEDHQPAVGEQPFGAHGGGVLDILDDLMRFLLAVDAGQHTEGPFFAARHHQVARRLGHQAYQHREQRRRHCLAAEHIAPSRLDSPGVAAGCHRVDALSDLLDDRVGVRTEDEEVDEVDHQLAEDNGELVPAHQLAASVGRRHLADIHRADGAGQTYAHAANHAVDVEHPQQTLCGFSLGEEEELGIHRP